jgi:DNA-binding transcriptional ArsR family regulator
MPDTPREELVAVAEVGPVQDVLQAIADPVRLEMVRRLAAAPDLTERCAALYDGIGKSTASHHFKVLRESGLTERLSIDGQPHQRLRLAEVGERYPGLLDTVIDALDD